MLITQIDVDALMNNFDRDDDRRKIRTASAKAERRILDRRGRKK